MVTLSRTTRARIASNASRDMQLRVEVGGRTATTVAKPGF
jgi:hypothetical protein